MTNDTENENKDIVNQIEAIARKEKKSGLVMASMKGKPNITALIIDVKLRDKTLTKQDLMEAIKTNPPEETLNTLKVGVAELEAQKKGKPLLVYLAETEQSETMKLAINQKEKYNNLDLPGITEAIEIAKDKKNEAMVDTLTDTQKEFSKKQVAKIKTDLKRTSRRSSGPQAPTINPKLKQQGQGQGNAR